ncbi:hypothetical protein DFH08DRAFT_812578 [Mycena albidolilacea]|uniref:Uncharacterized protein n=1 Tax=Mycena albidolilacea TaxID=1033008 RepID=A0AAD7EMR3_9AGAR|nr:hypothetical protein DFH08DRAFT_812578 [Mycena albidolilacea]
MTTMPPISVSGSTLNRAANPTPFLFTDIPSQRTVRTTAGLIPASSWLRYNDDHYAFKGLHHQKDHTTQDSPPPRASSPDFPPLSELMPPSTPLKLTCHKQARLEWEVEHADPGNEAKALEYHQLCEDYAADFGLFIPDTKIDKHLILRRQESTQLDGLWEQACEYHYLCLHIVSGTNMRHRAYMDAVEEFNTTFGQPYQRYDGKANFWTDVAVTWRRSSGLWGSGCMKSVGSTLSLWVIHVQAQANIAPESNFWSTLEDATVILTYLNSDYRKPLSVRCRRKYLKYKLLVIELAAMQAAAEVEARQWEVPPTISMAVFYGVVGSLFLG